MQTPIPTSPSILCFQSLPAQGCVGLKAYAQTLSTHWIPVPSLLLNGPGNMPGCKRFAAHGIELLQAVLDTLQVDSKVKPAILIGYLANAQQQRDLIELLRASKALFSTIAIDPICGDQNRPYVSTDIIKNYPQLLALADLHLPNETELKLISGCTNTLEALDWWAINFPASHLIATGIQKGREMGVVHQFKGTIRDHFHEQKGHHLPGAGDLFAGKFIYGYTIEGITVFNSILKSVNFVINRFENIADFANDIKISDIN